MHAYHSVFYIWDVLLELRIGAPWGITRTKISIIVSSKYLKALLINSRYVVSHSVLSLLLLPFIFFYFSFITLLN